MIFVTAMEVVKSEQKGELEIRQSEAPQEIGSKSLAAFTAPPHLGSAWLVILAILALWKPTQHNRSSEQSHMQRGVCSSGFCSEH